MAEEMRCALDCCRRETKHGETRKKMPEKRRYQNEERFKISALFILTDKINPIFGSMSDLIKFAWKFLKGVEYYGFAVRQIFSRQC